MANCNYYQLLAAGPDYGSVGLECGPQSTVTRKFLNYLSKGAKLGELEIPQHVPFNERGNRLDFIPGYGFCPYVTQVVVQEFSDLADVEFASVGFIADQEYFTFNVTNVVDCVDFDQSELRLFMDGRMRPPRSLYFDKSKADKAGNIFRPKSFENIIVCDLAFIQRVLSHRFTGVGFKKTGDWISSLSIDHIKGFPIG